MIEADPKHRDLVLRALALDDASNGLMSNGEPQKDTKDDEGYFLDPCEATAYRAICARLNFLAQDSPELQFPAKELSRSTARPTVGSWARLKKTARFLVRRRRVVWSFGFQEEPTRLQVFTYSDGGGTG